MKGIVLNGLGRVGGEARGEGREGFVYFFVLRGSFLDS